MREPERMSDPDWNEVRQRIADAQNKRARRRARNALNAQAEAVSRESWNTKRRANDQYLTAWSQGRTAVLAQAQAALKRQKKLLSAMGPRLAAGEDLG